MKKTMLLAMVTFALAGAGIAANVASAGGGTGITATPAAYKTWAGTYTAKFVRAASGIINETNRTNSDPSGHQNDWTSADVYLQFRPLIGPGTGSPTPNPACDPNGLVTAPFRFVNNAVVDPSIGGT